jgi:proline iminopeptidase
MDPARSMLAQDLFPPIEPFTQGRLDLDGRHAMYWEVSGNPEGRPVVFLHGGPGRRGGAGPPPLLRPAPLPHRGLRPARRRPLDPAGRAGGQHHPAPDRRHGAPARPPRHHALARLRRLLGLDPRARLCPGASGARQRLDAARHLPRQPRRGRLVPLRHGPPVSRALAQLRGRNSRGRARRPDERLREAPEPPGPAVHLPAARAWSVYEGSLLDPAAESRRPWPPSARSATPSGCRASRRISSSTASSWKTARC